MQAAITQPRRVESGSMFNGQWQMFKAIEHFTLSIEH
jgi:hypothetical protein